MKNRILIIFLVALTVFWLQVLPTTNTIQSADEPVTLSNVTLWLYPEYDDPRLLVMLEGQISGTNAPTLIKFLVPTSAEMYSAGSKDVQGKYSGGPPDRKQSQIPGWDEISYTLQNSTFRMEYYDAIITGQTDKTISYDFLSLFPIINLDTIVQVPLTATNFTVKPQGTKTIEGSFTVYSSRYNNLSINQALHFDITYSKSNSNPSINNTQAASQVKGDRNTLPLMVIIVVILAVGILFWIIKSTRAKRDLIQARTDRSQPAKKQSKQLPSKYCSQCGKQLQFPSKYCPHYSYKIDNHG